MRTESEKGRPSEREGENAAVRERENVQNERRKRRRST